MVYSSSKEVCPFDTAKKDATRLIIAMRQDSLDRRQAIVDPL